MEGKVVRLFSPVPVISYETTGATWLPDDAAANRPTPPVDCSAPIPGFVGRAGQRFERALVASCQPEALAFHPTLELEQARDVETVEERPAVQADCGGVRAASSSRFELQRVGRDGGRIEPHRPQAHYEDVAVQILPQREERLLETVPGMLGVALRPEIGEELVASDPKLPR